MNRSPLRFAVVLVSTAWPLAVAVGGRSAFDDYWLSIGLGIAFFAVVAVGFSLMLDLGGMLSLAQGMFAGIGMYGVARSPWDGSWSLLYAVLWGTVVALALGLLVLRLRNVYFALGTLAATFVAEGFVRGNSSFGGPSGLIVTASPPFGMVAPADFFVAGWVLVFAVLLFARSLRTSPYGIGGRAVAHDSDLAEAAGVSPRSVRFTLFMFSSVLATFAGGLYGHFLLFVSPPALGLFPSLQVAVASALGGVLAAPTVVGMAIVRLLPEFGVSGASVYLIVLGTVLGGLVIIVPNGLRFPRVALLARPEPRPNVAVDAPALTARSPRTFAGPALVADDVSVSFGGLRAVDGVSLTVTRGEVLGLIGPNGAGKTTLFNLLSGAVRADGGTVGLDGVDVSNWSATRRARAGVGRTFQTPRLFAGATVFEIAMLGTFRCSRGDLLTHVLGIGPRNRRRLHAQAWEALDRVGLAAHAGEKAERLSTGRRKLLEVARALAAQPAVLLLDEPAAGLDQGEVDELGALIRRLADAGLAILLIEHGIELVMGVSDRVAVMEAGRLIVTGAPSEVREDPEVVRAYIG